MRVCDDFILGVQGDRQEKCKGSMPARWALSTELEMMLIGCFSVWPAAPSNSAANCFGTAFSFHFFAREALHCCT